MGGNGERGGAKLFWQESVGGEGKQWTDIRSLPFHTMVEIKQEDTTSLVTARALKSSAARGGVYDRVWERLSNGHHDREKKEKIYLLQIDSKAFIVSSVLPDLS